MNNPFNPFKDKCVDALIYKAIAREIKEAIEKIYEKYKEKIKDIREIEDGMVGFDSLKMRDESMEYIKNDKDLCIVYKNAQKQRVMSKNIVKRTIKECMNEILDDTPIIDNGVVKTKRMLIAEKIVDGVLDGTINPAVVRAFEVIRDTVGEKPVSEIINKGIQQKVIDVNITQEKVERVQNILENLRSAKVTDGLRENRAIRTVDAGYGNERVVEVDVSGKSEGIHNIDVLPDKQD